MSGSPQEAHHKVLVVDDHGVVATTLSAALQAKGYGAQACAGTTDDVIMATVADYRPDIVLLDLSLGRGRNSIPLISPLVAAGARVVMLTADTDPMRHAECVEAGAAGVVSKCEDFDAVAAALQVVAERGSLLTASQREALLAQLQSHRARQEVDLSAFRALTAREENVLSALLQGKTAQGIATEEFISVRTVRGHIQNVLDKLGVNSQIAAVAKARDADWQPRSDG